MLPYLRQVGIVPGVVCPALEPTTQDRHGPGGVSPEECLESGQGARIPLVKVWTEEVGRGFSAWRRFQRDITASFQYLKGAHSKARRNCFKRPVVIGQVALV